MNNDKNTIEPTDAIEAAVEAAQEQQPEANKQAPSTVEPKQQDRPNKKDKKTEEVVKPVPVSVPDPEKEEETSAQRYMKNYIERYLAINDGMLDTEAKKKDAIAAFKKLCYHAINNASDLKVLDMVLDMFKKNRNVVLSEELALQGLAKFSKVEQMQLSVFYRMFFDYSNPKRNRKKATVNMDQVRSIFGNDHIVNYLVRKFPK